MSARQQPESASGNQRMQSPICGHCAGVTSHETWCITCNAIVLYAFEIVLDAYRLSLEDEIILHALGVQWSRAADKGT